MTAPLEDEDIVDFDMLPEDEDVVDFEERPKNKRKQSWEEYLKTLGKDIAVQTGRGTAKGFGGAYGNIASLLGLNAPESDVEEELRDEQFEAVETLQDPNSTFMERFLANMAVVEDDDIIRRYSPLPTSQDIGEHIDPMFGEAETTAGRYGERIGELFGGGAGIGLFNPIPAVTGGAAGQTVEEFGGGPLAQVAAEIAGMIAGGSITGTTAASNKEVQESIKYLRGLGYTEEEIAVAVNAAKKSSVWKYAKPTGKAKEAVSGAMQKSEQAVEQVLSNVFPGLEEGLPTVREAASEIFTEVMESASQVPLKNVKTHIDNAKNLLKDFKNNINPLPQSQESQLINLAEESIKKLSKGKPSADQLIELHKKFNQIGKWADPKMRERTLGKMKELVKDAIGSENEQLLTQFEEANLAWKNYKSAESASELIRRAVDSEGSMNFNKLKNMVDNPRNRKNLEKWLGEPESKNLYKIAKVGKDVGNIGKMFGNIDKNIYYQSARVGSAAYGIWNQDWRYVAGALGGTAARRLATKSLTDPKFQGVLIKGLNAIKNQSPAGLQRASIAMEKYLQDEGIVEDEDLIDF